MSSVRWLSWESGWLLQSRKLAARRERRIERLDIDVADRRFGAAVEEVAVGDRVGHAHEGHVGVGRAAATRATAAASGAATAGSAPAAGRAAAAAVAVIVAAAAAHDRRQRKRQASDESQDDFLVHLHVSCNRSLVRFAEAETALAGAARRVGGAGGAARRLRAGGARLEVAAARSRRRVAAERAAFDVVRDLHRALRDVVRVGDRVVDVELRRRQRALHEADEVRAGRAGRNRRARGDRGEHVQVAPDRVATFTDVLLVVRAHRRVGPDRRSADRRRGRPTT